MTAQKQIDKKDNYICIGLILAICLIPRLILCMQALPVRTRMDELATMAGAAYFAGLDWSGVMGASSYYGTGFTGMFFFLFRLTDNPFVIYRFMICVCALLQTATGLMCYSMMKKYFHVRNKWILVLSSVASSYFVVTRAVIVYNEHMLIFLMWLITWLLLKVCNEEKRGKRRILTMLLALVLAYSVSVHVRGITFTIALAILIVVAYLYKKAKVVDLPVLLGVCAAGLAAISIYVSWIQGEVWMAQAGQTLANSKIEIGSKFSYFLEKEGILGAFFTIIGQLHTIGLVSAGITTLMICVFFCLIGKLWGRSHKKDRFYTSYLVILTFSLLCMAITIAGQSVTWLDATTLAVKSGPEAHLYWVKGFTYIRYFGPYCGPLVMLFGVLLDKNMAILKKCVLPAGIVSIVFEMIWCVFIVPYFVNIERIDGLEALLCLVFSGKKGDFSRIFFLKVALVGCFVILLLSIALKLGKKKLLCAFLMLFLVYQYIYNAIVWDINGNQKSSYALVNKTYELIDELEEIIELPNTLYVIPVSNHYYEHQFVFNRYRIVPEAPAAEITEDAMVLSRNVWEASEGYQEYKLDKDEYLYVKGEAINRAVEGLIGNSQ